MTNQTPRSDRKPDRVIGGRYRLLSVIGSGGMGVVYRAEHVVLKREFALKLLHAHFRSHPRGEELRQRFLREAEWLARLDQHPHMVGIVDAGVTEDGTLYMAMELCEGEALVEVLGRGPLAPARAVHITVQILRALIHAHGHGIVHRDLKPDNIMLTSHKGRADFVKVLDFGIAKLLSEVEVPMSAASEAGSAEAQQALSESARDRALTEAGVVFGTPEYLAPEQALGKDVDQRADLYPVGVMLWEMLVGRRPFSGATPMEVIGQHLTATPEPPSSHCTTPVPQALDAAVLTAMAKKPEERFPSADEFLKALDVALEALSAPSGRISTPLLSGILRVQTTSIRKSSPASTPEEKALVRPRDSALARVLPPLVSRLVFPLARAVSALRLGQKRASGALQRHGERLGVRGTALVVFALVVVGLLGILGGAVILRGRIERSTPKVVAKDPPVPTVAPKPAAPEPAQSTAVPMELLIERLELGRSCGERRSAALALLALRDPRALEPLRRAHRKATGKNAKNGCMLRELTDALQILSAETPKESGK